MAFVQVKLDEADVVFLLVVVEGAAHIRVVIDHGKAVGHVGQQGALNAHGEQHDAEDQIKQIVGERRIVQHCIDGEHDGGCAAQASPGDQRDLPGLRPEGRQQRRHRHRPPHQSKKGQNAQRGHKDPRQLGRGNQKTQQKEDHHLGDAGDRVKKAHQVPFLGDGCIAHQNAAQIHAQIAVAAQHGGQGIGNQGGGKHEDGVALSHGSMGTPQQKGSGNTNAHAEQNAEYQLFGQNQRHRDVAAGHQGHQHHREHIGHGVVGAGLQLQQTGGVELQVQAAGPQNVEHRGRVGGSDDRADEQALQPGKPQHQVDEQAGEPGGEQYTQGGEQHRLHRHRPGGLPVGAKATVIHDKDQTHRADGLGQGIVVEPDAKQSVFPEQHAQTNEHQQGGDGKLFGEVVGQNAGQDHHSDQQKNSVQGLTSFETVRIKPAL